jgi:hypothetical protein
MSDDLREDLREARGTVRVVIAKLRAQADEAAAELARLEPQLAQVRAEAADARAAGPSARATQYEALLRDFEAKVTALRAEQYQAEQAIQDLKGETRALERSERDVLLAPVRVALAPDPFARSVEDVALGNVRGGLADLDAAARLEAELNPAASLRPGAAGGGVAGASAAPAAPAVPAAPALSPEEQARAELAALKARRGPGSGKPGSGKTM